MPDCIFCRIIARQAPAKVFYEDDTVLSFPNLSPVVPGHVMVVPKRHATNMLDIDPDQLGRVAASTQIVAKKVMAETKATGFNLLMANGKDAQQSVILIGTSFRAAPVTGLTSGLSKNSRYWT